MRKADHWDLSTSVSAKISCYSISNQAKTLLFFSKFYHYPSFSRIQFLSFIYCFNLDNKKKYLNYGDKWKYQYKKIDNEIVGGNIKYKSYEKLFNEINTELEVVFKNKENIIKWYNEVNK